MQNRDKAVHELQKKLAAAVADKEVHFPSNYNLLQSCAWQPLCSSRSVCPRIPLCNSFFFELFTVLQAMAAQLAEVKKQLEDLWRKDKTSQETIAQKDREIECLQKRAQLHDEEAKLWASERETWDAERKAWNVERKAWEQEREMRTDWVHINRVPAHSSLRRPPSLMPHSLCEMALPTALAPIAAPVIITYSFQAQELQRSASVPNIPPALPSVRLLLNLHPFRLHSSYCASLTLPQPGRANQEEENAALLQRLLDEITAARDEQSAAIRRGQMECNRVRTALSAQYQSCHHYQSSRKSARACVASFFCVLMFVRRLLNF